MSARQWGSVQAIPEGVTATDTAGVPFKRENGELYVELIYSGSGWKVADQDTVGMANIIGAPFTEVIA